MPPTDLPRGAIVQSRTEAQITSTQITGERFRLRKAYFALPEPVRLAFLRLIAAEGDESNGTSGTARQGP